MLVGIFIVRKNPWFRNPIIPNNKSRDVIAAQEVMYYNKKLFEKRPKFNKREVNAFLDIPTKKAALKVSSSVVSLVSYTGEQELIQCCGVIIENDGNNGYIVLTSAKLIRRPTNLNGEDVLEDGWDGEDDSLAESLKVIIYMNDGALYHGEVCAHDLHFNLAWIRFQSNSCLQIATIRQVDDYINLNSAEKSFNLRPNSTRFTLVPGDAIVAVGRYFAKPFDLMAAPGVFKLSCCHDFECKELFMGSCLITNCGEGSAVVNHSGEVIGIAFYDTGCTPFLPINIAQKCWEHYERGGLWRPFLGIVATNLYADDIHLVEKVIKKIPSICNGVVVEKVIQGSFLDSAGLQVNDVIIECDGKTVHSFLEFLEMVWDQKVGDILPLSVVRICQSDPICVPMVVDEVVAENFYRWPRNWR